MEISHLLTLRKENELARQKIEQDRDSIEDALAETLVKEYFGQILKRDPKSQIEEDGFVRYYERWAFTIKSQTDDSTWIFKVSKWYSGSFKVKISSDVGEICIDDYPSEEKFNVLQDIVKKAGLEEKVFFGRLLQFCETMEILVGSRVRMPIKVCSSSIIDNIVWK